jgi:radical SAM protein with 4Fe4S-binding SPASM domain
MSKIAVRNIFKLLNENKTFIEDFLSMGIRKSILNKVDYLREDNIVRPPIQVGLKLTNRCNMRCLMCAQWGESGYHLSKENQIPIQEEIPFSVYQKLFNDLKEFNPKYYIWGGEPFLYKDIFNILNDLKELKMTSSLVTNGFNLENDAEQIVCSGLNILFLSLDGPEELHDSIRNCKGSFSRIKRGIDAINTAKKKHKKNNPVVCLIFTVNNSNMEQIYNTFRLIDTMDVDFTLGYYSWFTNHEIGNDHQKIMKEKFDCTANSWRGYVYTGNKIDGTKVKEQMGMLNNASFRIPYNFFPNLKSNEIVEYYNNPSNTFKYKRCLYPWDTIEIQPNGDVVTCRDFPDYVTGNISNNGILDIINNEKSRSFRNELKKGLFPICSRCCGLMGV